MFIQSILAATMELATGPSKVGDWFQLWVKEDPFQRSGLENEFQGIGLEDDLFHVVGQKKTH
jgi:hypothetical protein